jgi:hypothetical protein
LAVMHYTTACNLCSSLVHTKSSISKPKRSSKHGPQRNVRMHQQSVACHNIFKPAVGVRAGSAVPPELAAQHTHCNPAAVPADELQAALLKHTQQRILATSECLPNIACCSKARAAAAAAGAMLLMLLM